MVTWQKGPHKYEDLEQHETDRTARRYRQNE